MPASVLKTMAAQLLILLVGSILLLTTAAEDAPGFNCYLAGNHVCGPTVTGLGFVNL